MVNNYNLFSFKLSIKVYNKLSDNLFEEFREAISNELQSNDEVKRLEKYYGIKLDMNEFNKSFREKFPDLVESQHNKLNNGIVFSVIAAFVCELAMKFLIVKNGSNFPHTHNLKNLYDKLEETQKDFIKKTTMKKSRFISELDFENQLISSSNNFATHRYIFENDEHELNDIFLKGFKDTLVELIEL